LSPYPASLWRRLAAAVYDLFLLLGVLLVATLLLLPFTGGQAIDGASPWFRAYILFVPYLFFGWFWTHGGETLGMRAWRLRVRTREGAAVGWGRAAIRYVIAWVSWLSVLGMLWIVLDPQRRAWQDIASGTEIVVEPRR